MKSLTTSIFFIVCCALATACDFDTQRQLDLQYPVTLEILNKSPNNITVKSIYNSADTIAGLVFKGTNISSGKYFIEGRCDKIKDWLVSGRHLTNSVTQNKN